MPLHLAVNDGSLHPPGCPIRKSQDQSALAAPLRVSSLGTSFVGTLPLGIRQKPCITLETEDVPNGDPEGSRQGTRRLPAKNARRFRRYARSRAVATAHNPPPTPAPTLQAKRPAGPKEDTAFRWKTRTKQSEKKTRRTATPLRLRSSIRQPPERRPAAARTEACSRQNGGLQPPERRPASASAETNADSHRNGSPLEARKHTFPRQGKTPSHPRKHKPQLCFSAPLSNCESSYCDAARCRTLPYRAFFASAKSSIHRSTLLSQVRCQNFSVSCRFLQASAFVSARSPAQQG